MLNSSEDKHLNTVEASSQASSNPLEAKYCRGFFSSLIKSSEAKYCRGLIGEKHLVNEFNEAT